jgi:AcrR family transcriptional regulator
VPRKYELGKRAVQQAETRRRILEAARDLYLEQGVSSTTMLDIARRADVAPGTVANHFGSTAALATELTTTLLADLHMPTPDVFDGVDRLPDRIGLLVRELNAFFTRTQPWWVAAQRERTEVGFWADAEARFYADLDTLVRAALGPLADDADAVAVVTTVLGRWVIGSLQATGRSEETSVALVTDLLAAWLVTRDVPG